MPVHICKLASARAPHCLKFVKSYETNPLCAQGWVLPSWQHSWSFQGALSAISLLALAPLHLSAVLANPGYIEPPKQQEQQEEEAGDGEGKHCTLTQLAHAHIPVCIQVQVACDTASLPVLLLCRQVPFFV